MTCFYNKTRDRETQVRDCDGEREVKKKERREERGRQTQVRD